MFSYLCRTGICQFAHCSLGARIIRYYILTGCLTQSWDAIVKAQGTKKNTIARCTLRGGGQVIGIRILPHLVKKVTTEVQKLLNVNPNAQHSQLPAVNPPEYALSSDSEFSEMEDVVTDQNSAGSTETDSEESCSED
jgi:hypothetical protein